MKRAYSPDSDPEDKSSNTYRKKCREDDDDGFIPASVGLSSNPFIRSNVLRLRLRTADESSSKGTNAKVEETLNDDDKGQSGSAVNDVTVLSDDSSNLDDKEIDNEVSGINAKYVTVLSDDSSNSDDKESDNSVSYTFRVFNSSEDEDDDARNTDTSSVKAIASSSEKDEIDSDESECAYQELEQSEEEQEIEQEEEEEEEEKADESMEENGSQASDKDNDDDDDDDGVLRVCQSCGGYHIFSE